MQTEGRCVCGEVRFEVNGEPLKQFYCHCRSCQIAHAAPVIAAAMFRVEAVVHTGELKRMTVTGRADAVPRLMCAGCGTKVMNVANESVRTIFPSLCETRAWFQPEMHMQWQERLLQMSDALPKFIDFPKEFGGSGSLV